MPAATPRRPPAPGSPEHALLLALAAERAAGDLFAQAEAGRAADAARWALVRQWTPWACGEAGRWYRRGGRPGDLDEWCQVAVLGLMDAAGLVLPDPGNPRTRRRKGGPNNARYDPAAGNGFSCYAAGYVRKWLGEFAHGERCGAVKRPRQERGPDGEFPAMAAVTGFPTDADGQAWEPAVREAGAPPPDEAEVWRAVSDLLPDRREWLVLWYRFRCGWTLDAIGAEFGVSKERVRQIQGKALDRLREHGAGLRAFTEG